jgi:hypothetical protein
MFLYIGSFIFSFATFSLLLFLLLFLIWFYINLPDGDKYTPKTQHLVWYKGKGQWYVFPKVVFG